MNEPPDTPFWATVATGVSHCGAGCTRGDVIAEFTRICSGPGRRWHSAAVRVTRRLHPRGTAGTGLSVLRDRTDARARLRDGITAAAKADILSLTAFEVGPFGWMALMAFVFFPDPHLHPNSPVYWFVMQIGMVIGFCTAWPANVWLITRSIKEAM